MKIKRKTREKLQGLGITFLLMCAGAINIKTVILLLSLSFIFIQLGGGLKELNG